MSVPPNIIYDSHLRVKSVLTVVNEYLFSLVGLVSWFWKSQKSNSGKYMTIFHMTLRWKAKFDTKAKTLKLTFRHIIYLAINLSTLKGLNSDYLHKSSTPMLLQSVQSDSIARINFFETRVLPPLILDHHGAAVLVSRPECTDHSCTVVIFKALSIICDSY